MVFPESNLRPQGSLFSKWYKKVSPESNLQPQGSIFLTWSNRRHLRYHHENNRRLLDSCEIWLSVRSYTHKCRHWNLLTEINLFLINIYSKKNVQSIYPKASFISDPNDFTPKSNNFTPNSSNPLRHPCLGLIKSLSFREINTELHLP